MRAYKYTGEDPRGEEFPRLVVAVEEEDGTVSHRGVHLLPGDVFTVDGSLDHPRLETAGRATKDMPHATVIEEPTAAESASVEELLADEAPPPELTNESATEEA